MKQNIEAALGNFERRFSRFIATSEVNAFRTASAGRYPLSREFLTLLERGEILRGLTDGLYDPAIAPLLEKAGYDPKYRLTPEGVEDFVLPEWRVEGGKLVLAGPAGFDFGGMGKGYAIDLAVEVMRGAGERHFLVEGGGDMYATTKVTGEPWRVGIEWPGNPEKVVGVVTLHNQALAVSDSFRRRWGRWHHIVNPKTRTPIETILGAAAVAPTAWDADSMTSGLFLAPPEKYPALAQEFQAKYLVFTRENEVRVSPDWEGELF